MSETNVQWSIYSAAQNLPAVLNDPHKGKQTNFFVKTWGDGFIEKTNIPSSPFLPEITYGHFDTYLKKLSKRFRRHCKLSQKELTVPPVKKELDANLDEIPEILLRDHFPLNEPKVFKQVFQKEPGEIDYNSRVLHEQLTHYLDIVEVQIANQVSQKSSAFFHAMTCHDTIMEQMGTASNEVRQVRAKVCTIDKELAKESIRLLSLARSTRNRMCLLEKLKLMSTVLQTQPNLQILLSSSDFVAALELISGAQSVLANQLAGVTSLRHLPSQLKEMSRLIDKMLSTEFERYAANDLHRPLDAPEGVLEPERLMSLVAGLLRQNHLQFLETYKQEAITAVQTIFKQLLIQQIADAEDDMEHCLTGSVDAPPSLDSSHWLKVLSLVSIALAKLVNRVYSVHNVIQQAAQIGAGVSDSFYDAKGYTDIEIFLSHEDLRRVELKLKDLLISICDYCHERLASLVSTQSEKLSINALQISQLSIIVEEFTDACENVSGKRSAVMKAAFKIQAGNYVNKFHSHRKHKLTLLLDAERWKIAEVPKEFQVLIDKLASGKTIESLPSSPIENNNKSTFNCLKVKGEEYVTAGTVLILIRLVCEYCVCAYDLPLLVSVIYRNLVELLRTFNSRSCQLVLGAGALSTTGLKTITSTNLALMSRALQLVLWMIPRVRLHFQSISTECVNSLDSVEKDIGHHIQQLESKVISIMNMLIGNSLNEWDAKPPVPSKVFRNISKHLSKLHEAVSNILPERQVAGIYEEIHKNFKTRLQEQLAKMNIQSDGGPQHGVVTSELTFYLETMKSLKIISENEFSVNSMKDIWNKSL